MNLCIRLLVLFLLCCNCATGQTPAPALLSKPWKAQWIAHPDAQLKQYEVYNFRKQINLQTVPEQFIINLSADSRYKLFINGKQLGMGPARSDLDHWNYETYNLAHLLHKGLNTLAVTVWNQGEWNAYSQHSSRTALIVQGNGDTENIVNTNESWKVYKNEAYSPVIFKPVDKRLFWQYYVAGALDSLQAAKYPWGWETENYDDSKWLQSKTIGNGYPDGNVNTTQWTLTPRATAMLEETSGRFKTVRRSVNITADASFPAGNTPLIIPPHQKVSLLLDNQLEVTAYPRLVVSDGKNASIKINYAEVLLETEKNNPYKWHKGDRDVIDGKKLYGVYDMFMPDGGKNREFVPLWMRVFRYVQLDIETNNNPLVINNISYTTVMYPFANEASFESNDSVHKPIFDACLNTIRLASQETYIDPYYEQMQYIGDTRLQSLYAYYHFTDDRLTENAIKQFGWSQDTNGLVMSRYPSDLPQYTPLFSLCWTLMIKDRWMLRPDDKFSGDYIPQMLHVLNWFEKQVNKEGMLGNLNYLDFLDSDYPHDKVLNQSQSKSLTPSSLFFVYTVQQLKPFFIYYHQYDSFKRYEELANKIKQNVISKCYDSKKGLFAENADKKIFSEHSNVMAVLTGCVTDIQKKEVLRRMLADTSLLKTSLYFKFYEFAALKDAGMANEILSQLGPWKQMLANNMHTFSEWLIDPRSECHSWSAYPAYYFLNTVAGIGPGSPGFKTVVINPNLGDLTSINATMPHPNGLIKVAYTKNKLNWNISIELPRKLTGVFKWKGKVYTLKEGIANKFTI
jgi:alpha-L-rhamnosidase